MEIRTLRYFLAVAKYGSMSKAADVLFLSQPALTKQIQSLEKEVGTKLFTRTKYHVELTPAGELLSKRAQEIISLEALTKTELAAENRKVSGSLTLAFIDRTISSDIAGLIESFKNSYQDVRITLLCGSYDYISELFKKDKADVFCNFFGSVPEGTRTVDAGFSRRIGFVIRKDSRLAEYSELDKDLYDDISTIMPIGKMVDESGQDFLIDIDEDHVIARVQEPLDFLFLINDSDTCMYCLEPTHDILQHYDLVFRPVAPQRSARLLFVLRNNEEPSEAALAFMDHTEAYINTAPRHLISKSFEF